METRIPYPTLTSSKSVKFSCLVSAEASIAMSIISKVTITVNCLMTTPMDRFFHYTELKGVRFHQKLDFVADAARIAEVPEVINKMNDLQSGYSGEVGEVPRSSR